MPQAIPLAAAAASAAAASAGSLLLPSAIAAGAVGTFAGLSAAAWTAIGFGSSVGIGLYERNKAKKAANKARDAAIQDRLLNYKSTVASRRYVIGKLRLGGTIMYVEPIGPDGEALDSVIAYACNPCSLVAWYLGDERVLPANFPGPKYGTQSKRRGVKRVVLAAGVRIITLDHDPITGSVVAHAVRDGGDNGDQYDALTPTVIGRDVTVTVPTGGATVDISYDYLTPQKLRGQWKTGIASQDSTAWSGYASPGWTADHRLRGVAHARTLNVWDESVYADGLPEVTVEVHGNGFADYSFFDPRTGTSAPYSQNPAIIAVWWATLPKTMGGCGVPTALIDWPSVSAAANVCDENITVRKTDGSGYESIPRYRCDTVLDTARSPRENLDAILSSMAGDFVFTGGAYRMMAGSFRAATRTLTDDDIISISGSTYNASEPPPNVVNARFVSAAEGYVVTSAPAVRNDAYIAYEGQERPIDLGELPATTDPRRANYLMGAELERARPAMALSVKVSHVGEDIRLLDTLAITISDGDAYASRTYEVRGSTDNWDGTHDLELVEIRPNTWALDADRFTPVVPVVPPDLSYLWNVAPLTGFDVLDGQTSDGIEIAWDLHSQASVRQGGKIELRYRKIGTDQWRDLPSAAGDSTGTTLTIAVVRDETYEFQGRAVNGLGAVSPWAYEFVTVVAAVGTGASLQFLGEFATDPNPAEHNEGDVYRNSGTKDLMILRNGAWELFLESGVDGAPGTAELLQLHTTSNIFRVDQSGNGAPSSITLTALGQNLTGTPTFSVAPVGAATLTGSGTTRTLTFANMHQDLVQVTATQDGDTSGLPRSDTVTIIKGYDGSSAINAILTNEVHALAAQADGDVLSYASATTKMLVYIGDDDDTAAWNFAIGTKTPTSLVATVSNVVGAARGTVTVTDGLTTDEGAVEVIATKGAATISRTFKLVKAKQGPDGPAGPGAKMLTLQASSLVFKVPKAGGSVPTSITFTAAEQNLGGSYSWTSPGGTLTGSGATRTLTFANMSVDSVTVTVSRDGLSDAVTVHKIFEGADGENAIQMVADNEAHTIAADSAGVVPDWSSAICDFHVYDGLTDVTSLWTFSRTLGPGVTAAAIVNGGATHGRLSVTNMDADTGTVTVTATRSGYPTQTKRFSISKSRQGTGGLPGADGTRGSAHAYLSGYSAWNTTAANNYFQNTYGAPRIVNDMVTMYNSTTFSQTRIWNGTAWSVVTQAHDGTLLIDGSVGTPALEIGAATEVYFYENYDEQEISILTPNLTPDVTIGPFAVDTVILVSASCNIRIVPGTSNYFAAGIRLFIPGGALQRSYMTPRVLAGQPEQTAAVAAFYQQTLAAGQTVTFRLIGQTQTSGAGNPKYYGSGRMLKVETIKR